MNTETEEVRSRTVGGLLLTAVSWAHVKFMSRSSNLDRPPPVDPPGLDFTYRRLYIIKADPQLTALVPRGRFSLNGHGGVFAAER